MYRKLHHIYLGGHSAASQRRESGTSFHHCNDHKHDRWGMNKTEHNQYSAGTTYTGVPQGEWVAGRRVKVRKLLLTSLSFFFSFSISWVHFVFIFALFSTGILSSFSSLYFFFLSHMPFSSFIEASELNADIPHLLVLSPRTTLRGDAHKSQAPALRLGFQVKPVHYRH